MTLWRVTACPAIVDLRNLLARRFTQPSSPPTSFFTTGISAFDAAAGGLPKNAITELTSTHPSAGSAFLMHALLQTARRERFFLALVDGSDSFDPQSAGAKVLPHLLWLRCHHASEAVKAADLLLRDGNFPLVILDLILNPAEQLRRIPAANWYRLQRLVERIPTAFLVMSRHNLVASARLKLVLDRHWSLADFAREEVLPQLHLHVQRAAAFSP